MKFSSLAFFLFFGWLGALLILALRHGVPPEASSSLLRTLLYLGLLLGALLAVGGLCLRAWKPRFSSLSEEACFALGLGAVFFNLLFLVAGHWGRLNRAFSLAALGLSWLLGAPVLRRFYRQFKQALLTKHPWEGSSTEMLTLFAAGIAVLGALAICLFRAPQGSDGMPLTLACSSLDGPRLAMLWDLSCALATALLLADLGARFLPMPRIWFGAALLLVQPLLANLVADLSPALPGGLMAFLSLAAFLNTRRERSLKARGHWFQLAALMAGGVLLFQPSGSAHAAALLLLLAFSAFKDPDERQPGQLLLCVVLFSLPLLPGRILGLSPPVAAPAAASGQESLRLLDLPLSFLFLAVLPVFFFMRFAREMRWLTAYLGVTAALWLAGPRQMADLYLFLPALALLAAYGFGEVESWTRSGAWRKAMHLLLVLGLFLSAWLSLTPLRMIWMPH